MIALDTNLLVYAHRGDSEWHPPARRALAEVATGSDLWAIPWPCVHEFLAVVTNARIFSVPTSMERACQQVQMWMESPTLRLLAETNSHWQELAGILAAARLSGARVHDARVAALCLQHGVSELWSADRDFNRIPGLRVRNPLV